MRWLVLLFVLILQAQCASAEDLDFDLEIQYPRYQQPTNSYEQFIYNKWDHVPGVVQLDLVGPQGAIVRQLRQRVKGQARDILRFQYDEGGLTWPQYIRRLEEVDYDLPAYGHWWERAWFYSLTPDQGGAPYKPIVKTYGWNWGIPDDFPILGWLKRKFQSLGDIWIDNTQEFDDIDNRNRLDNENQFSQRRDRESINYTRLERTPNTSVGLSKGVSVKSYRWYEGARYHFRFRPSVRFRPTQGADRTIDEISLRFLIELYTDKGHHMANIVLFARYDIPQQQTYLSAALVLVNW